MYVDVYTIAYTYLPSNPPPPRPHIGHMDATDTAILDFVSGRGTGKLCVYDPSARTTTLLLTGVRTNEFI